MSPILKWAGVTSSWMSISRRTATTPQPTVIYMHGGFWVAGNEESAILSCCHGWKWAGTWSMWSIGWARPRSRPRPPRRLLVRIASRAGAGPDVQHRHPPLVVTGESAGGHLALALGTIPESEGLDRECAGRAVCPKLRR